MYDTKHMTKKKNELSFTLEGGHIKTKMDAEQLQEHLKLVKQGTGRHKSKKDYRRKEKHHKRYC
ncbi:TPA: hypothetical protein KOX39_003445 [Clostridioides difficile]|nr:hypothetical protein [Clostridioides difficile]